MNRDDYINRSEKFNIVSPVEAEAINKQAERNFEKAYRELIAEVRSKFPGETRHETALRYIREGENRATGAGGMLMDINEHLAVKVMGWKAHNGNYYKGKKRSKYSVEKWRPELYIGQAIMCATKTGKHWILEQTEEGEFYSSVKNPSRREYLGMASSKTSAAEALSLAVARATGFEE